MLLHIFAHIHANHRRFIVEDEVGKRLGQLRFADPRGAEEQEGADGAVGVFQARTGAAHGGGNGFYRLLLPNDALADGFFHRQQFFALALQHFIDRHARPAADHGGDVRLTHDFARIGASFGGLLGIGELFLERGDDAVGEFARAREVAFALGGFEFELRGFELFLEVTRFVEAGFFRLPAGRKPRRFRLEFA